MRLLRSLLIVLLLAVLPAHGDILKIPVAEEIEMGREASTQFEASHRLTGGPALGRIEAVGARLAEKVGRTDMPFSFHLVDEDSINAITFPGGYIYVYRGLMDADPDDDELAGVLGHEMAHAVKSHAFKRLLPAYLFRKLQGKLTGSEHDTAVTKLVEALSMTGVGRQLEFEADRLGVGYASAAGFDPEGLVRVLQFFEKMERGHSGQLERLLSTHPRATERIKKVRPVVARLKRR